MRAITGAIVFHAGIVGWCLAAQIHQASHSSSADASMILGTVIVITGAVMTFIGWRELKPRGGDD